LGKTKPPPAITAIKDYGKLPRVTCYPSQLNQVFMHLLNNAIDALAEGKKASGTGRGQEDVPHPAIWIHTELTAKDTVLIRIADNGPGISEPALSRLFDPFFTTKKVGTGAGLGLSISYQIVAQQHKGQLTCSSPPGQGAEFTIEIPASQLE
ncbi:sensor histidine kinase, partial [Kamptonema formosum]|uniref:sensor histidine kinase n=1 Tax=Kamptonema formosum TaxID=331992 RepID=UPI000372678D